ncbi:sensor histidine kinase [Paenibacillus nanensis]|uniref:histidine kinase n=1 Tax=Paenibacillus nanensis TaxID=393251 RepID=A0A3A1UQF2_9BACL|nr:HAMP domain-containing sensor histidine kinase [Paenibacillus nanensis]RIX50494.1 sensor histidine kinase [Paenibacillus nanensis]
MKRQLSIGELIWHGFLTFTALILACGGAFTGAYFLTRWYYESHPVPWSDYVVQLVNCGVALLLIILLILLVNLFSRPKQRVFWNEMMDAFRRIAKGDFSVVIDQEGKYHGHIGEFVDSINEMTQELKQVERLRQQFISDVSHEIQSPLTSIRGFASTLQREDLTREEQRRYLAIIEKETVRLSRLSDNLLKLASLDSEDQEWPMASYRLDTQIEHIILACEPQWLQKSLDIELDAVPCEINANEELMSQVWQNLIHNAIKFTPDGGSIRVFLRPTDEGVLLAEISDTGIGIQPEDQKRIFERFYKGDKQRTRTTEGNGLGLSIVQKIVRLHKGTIRVQSILGVGTTFEVRLPKP